MYNDIFTAEYISEFKMAIEDNLDNLTGKYKDFAIYRFGLLGNPEHSREDTAEHFSISLDRICTLENSICMKATGRSLFHWIITGRRANRLKNFLE